MNNNYVAFNIKENKLYNEDDTVCINNNLYEVIITLNNKGYLTNLTDKARISKPFIISCLIHELVEKKLLNVNDDNIEDIKKCIKSVDYESTIIEFKKDYKFKTLPKGFTYANKILSYNLSALKNKKGLHIKELLELDKENHKSLNELKKWVKSLPNNKGDNI